MLGTLSEGQTAVRGCCSKALATKQPPPVSSLISVLLRVLMQEFGFSFIGLITFLPGEARAAYMCTFDTPRALRGTSDSPGKMVPTQVHAL